ncbi:hypothetical protein C2S53_002121 [Perilla frutescens var. hirtella]|uniref:Uncharacterized protein n=1 Tax=Perilla frutescens var. hirtella TaxID=608512 RepID=A0AAD4IPK3_PERFH|nr:hypothetical protein C2S53_002121 [Perilla frutescens var. hirtella]
MSKAEEVKLHIKVLINKEKSKVLFAEAGSDFTDVLLSFLLLPLGHIVEVLKQHYGDGVPVIGSLNTLYNGVANLDIIHFQMAVAKRRLLMPTICYGSHGWHQLRLNFNYAEPTSSRYGKSYDGVFTQCAASYIISDDLQVMPTVVGSIMKTLSTLGIALTDMDGAETRNVAFGLNEIVALLKESLISQNPLTALLLPENQMTLASLKSESSLPQIDQKGTSLNSKKMILKVMIQKSTNKLVFAQADQDFINFLFGLLAIPLGKVECYLGSNTGLKNQQYHVKRERMYMVSDDLTVAPLAITSFLSVLNEFKISLSDVKEMEVEVGLDEGLSIVKAALTSTTALTDGLIKGMLKKQSDEEMEEQIGVEEDFLIHQISKKRAKHPLKKRKEKKPIHQSQNA